MTKAGEQPALQTCESVLTGRGFDKKSSNMFQHRDVSQVYLFDKPGPTQRWRIHVNKGGSWPVHATGAGPEDLLDNLRNYSL